MWMRVNLSFGWARICFKPSMLCTTMRADESGSGPLIVRGWRTDEPRRSYDPVFAYGRSSGHDAGVKDIPTLATAERMWNVAGKEPVQIAFFGSDLAHQIAPTLEVL